MKTLTELENAVVELKALMANNRKKEVWTEADLDQQARWRQECNIYEGMIPHMKRAV